MWKKFRWLFHLPSDMPRYFSLPQGKRSDRWSHERCPEHGECPVISLSREKGSVNSGSFFGNLSVTFTSFHPFQITVHIAKGQHRTSNLICRNEFEIRLRFFGTGYSNPARIFCEISTHYVFGVTAGNFISSTDVEARWYLGQLRYPKGLALRDLPK